MPSLTVQTHIDAPPQRVFAVFTDLARAAENMQGVKRLDVLTDGPIGKGTRFRETRVMFGREATEEMEITAFEPDQSYTVGCDAHGAHYVTRFDFHPDGEGTRVEMCFGVTPLSLFARLLSPLSRFMMGGLKKALDQDLSDLKAAVERPA